MVDLMRARAEATKPDERKRPPIKLEYRKTLSIPAGTIYGFNEDLVNDFLINRDSKVWDINAFACEVKINESEFSLCLIHLELAAKQLQLAYSEILSTWDYIHPRLFAMMIFMKFPYKEFGLDEFNTKTGP